MSNSSVASICEMGWWKTSVAFTDKGENAWKIIIIILSRLWVAVR